MVILVALGIAIWSITMWYRRDKTPWLLIDDAAVLPNGYCEGDACNQYMEFYLPNVVEIGNDMCKEGCSESVSLGLGPDVTTIGDNFCENGC